MGIEVGKKAPLFTLPNQNDEKVALKDLLGQWIVLYFYPKDDTPGCTTQACEFTAGVKGFEKLNAKIYGVSPDSTESHRAFIAKHRLKIDLLSDSKLAMMPKYAAYGEKVMYGKKKIGVIRSTVIIDPDGRVAHHWRAVKAAGHAEKVREILTKLQQAS